MMTFWFSMFQWIFQVPVKGGRDYITPQKAIYKWYILPIGGLYATYHPLKEPEKSIECSCHSVPLLNINDASFHLPQNFPENPSESDVF